MNVKLIRSGYAGEGNRLYEWVFEVEGEPVAVTRGLERRGDWWVTFSDGLDYEGSKHGLLKRYPFFRKYL